MSEAESHVESKIAYRGSLFEVEQRIQPDGRIFEVARRAPGVRLVIPNRQYGTLLLTREYRRELGDYDYRLPGGKVFDSLAEYDSFRESGEDILVPATAKAIGEGAEEAGIDIKTVEFIRKSTLGATVEWDLLLFEATEWEEHPDGQQLEDGEQIESVEWFAFDDVQKMILDGQMQEDRVALALLQWLSHQ